MDKKQIKKDAVSYGYLAWQLNEIVSHMNDEEAYASWIYIWPDGETRQDANEDFKDKESYQELENSFKRIYKAYHRAGLYEANDRILSMAHKWDKKLGLPEIQNADNNTPSYNDDMEKEIIEILDQNNILYDELNEEYDENEEDKPYKVVYFYEGGEQELKKAYKLLKGKFTTVKPYFDGWNYQLLLSNFNYDEPTEDTQVEDTQVEDTQVEDKLLLLGLNDAKRYMKDSNTEYEERKIASRIMEGTNAELPGNVKAIVLENGGKIKRFDVQETQFTIEWEIKGEIHRNNFVLGKNMLNENILKFAEDIVSVNNKTTNDSKTVKDIMVDRLQELVEETKKDFASLVNETQSELEKSNSKGEDAIILNNFFDKFVNSCDEEKYDEVLYDTKAMMPMPESVHCQFVATLFKPKYLNVLYDLPISEDVWVGEYIEKTPENIQLINKSLEENLIEDSKPITDDDFELVEVTPNEVVEPENFDEIYEKTDYNHHLGIKYGSDDLVHIPTQIVICRNFRQFMENGTIPYEQTGEIASNLYRVLDADPNLIEDMMKVAMLFQEITGTCGIRITFANDNMRQLAERQSDLIEKLYGEGRIRTMSDFRRLLSSGEVAI